MAWPGVEWGSVKLRLSLEENEKQLQKKWKSKIVKRPMRSGVLLLQFENGAALEEKHTYLLLFVLIVFNVSFAMSVLMCKYPNIHFYSCSRM